MGNGIDGEMFPDKDKHPDCVGERAFAGKGIAGKGSTSFFFNSNQVSCVAHNTERKTFGSAAILD